MSKLIKSKGMLILVLFIILISGCNSRSKSSEYQKNEEITIYYKEKAPEEDRLSVIITIYEDDEYRYSINDVYAYVLYKDEQITYKEALDKQLVTIDDLLKAGAQIFKEKK